MRVSNHFKASVARATKPWKKKTGNPYRGPRPSGEHRAQFYPRLPDDPDYVPRMFQGGLSERQQKILNGEIPLENVRRQELGIIKKKAEHMGFEDALMIVTGLQQKLRGVDLQQIIQTTCEDDISDILKRLDAQIEHNH